ncbi:MAG: hypothetical protein II837_10240 [Treponema sp.]|nr:hypothetical protein [Treponema sp.]MBQ7166962.1 hypothetical protein [Treponema sp.]
MTDFLKKRNNENGTYGEQNIMAKKAEIEQTEIEAPYELPEGWKRSPMEHAPSMAILPAAGADTKNRERKALGERSQDTPMAGSLVLSERSELR